jgi:hypothetical protein
VYLPTGPAPVPVQLGKISGGKVKAWWFNPATGTAAEIGFFSTGALGPF